MKKLYFIGLLVVLSVCSFAQKQIKQYEYWFDNDYAGRKGETITANDSISLVSTIATGNLHEGLHAFQMRFKDKTGAWSVVSSQFFIKQSNRLPIGENKVIAYRYWLDKDFTKQKTVIVDPVNPFNLNSINIQAPAKATPANYEFFPDPISGHKITYHSQFWLNIQFKDNINQWSVVSRDSVLQPYSVNVQCDTLLSGVTKAKNYPKADTIHFFMDKAIAGDSLVFKLDKSLKIDLFDPTGKQIKTISKQASTTDQAFHTKLDGVYYALVHGFDEVADFYTLNYLHFPKYCVLNYNRKIVDNNGTDSIVFEGNGFTKNTKLTLTSGGNTIAGETILCNGLTVIKAGFTFKNTPVGQYDIHINYGDTTITIEKGLEVVNSLTHTVLFGAVSMPTKGNYPFAGIYEYDNLILDEGTTLLSYGISQLVIKVKGTLKTGKDVSIRVRNGYYANAPQNSINIITEENINNYASFKGEGYSLYANTFGKGGDGGNGGAGGFGGTTLVYIGNSPFYYLGYGGGGGGGGGAGYGGGIAGYGGSGGGGTSYSGASGTKGNGANGGDGGTGGWASSVGMFYNAGANGGDGFSIGEDGRYAEYLGGPGGGGNGGNGGVGGIAFQSGDPKNWGYSGGGGGGGGYGAGILVITANEIICDKISKPQFLALGQNGGKGGSGLINSTSGGDGEKGGDGLVIINTPNSVPEFIFSTDAFGSNYSPEIGGHGLVSGTAKVFINANEFESSIENVFSNENGHIQLTIYPNPTNEKVYVKALVDSHNSKISIYTLTGKLIREVNTVNPITEINISNLPNGIYLIKLDSDKGGRIAKLVKQ